MSIKVLGPLTFAAMVFVIAAAIKSQLFIGFTFWIEIAPELSLWSLGILFSTAVSEQTQFLGKTVYEIKQKKSGTGIEIDYKTVLPDRLEFTPKYIYFLFYSVTVWILTILINGHVNQLLGANRVWTLDIHAWNIVGLLLAGSSVGIAMRSIFEVS